MFPDLAKWYITMTEVCSFFGTSSFHEMWLLAATPDHMNPHNVINCVACILRTPGCDLLIHALQELDGYDRFVRECTVIASSGREDALAHFEKKLSPFALRGRELKWLHIDKCCNMLIDMSSVLTPPPLDRNHDFSGKILKLFQDSGIIQLSGSPEVISTLRNRSS